MKTKIQAGSEIETLTKDELTDVMTTIRKDWYNQVARGDAWPRFHSQGTISAGVVTIGGDEATDVALGPRDGFMWAVQRIAIDGLSSTESLAFYLNHTSPAVIVHPRIIGFQSFGQYDVVMKPGDQMVFTGTGLSSTGTVTITGQAREVPMPLAWRLGG